MYDEVTSSHPGAFAYNDIFFAPISLEKLSANAVSLEIWRREINQNRQNQNGELDKFNPFKRQLSLDWIKPLIPDVSPTIYGLIEEPIKRFGCSLQKWILAHYKGGLQFHYGHQNHVLADFDNFVCGYDGGIDFLKTAKLMVECGRFNLQSKFVIACMYFFENRIVRMWPVVSKKMAFEGITFDKSPLLFYWICRQKNKMNTIPTRKNLTVDEMMLESTSRLCYNRTPLEYFWNRIPVEKQTHWAENILFCRHFEPFVRFILPKIRNDPGLYDIYAYGEGAWYTEVRFALRRASYQFDEFIKGNYKSIIRLLECTDDRCVLATWSNIVENVNPGIFSNLMVKMITVKGILRKDRTFQHLWNLASNRQKGAVIHSTLFYPKYLENLKKDRSIPVTSASQETYELNVEYLLIILRFVAYTERCIFWQRCSSALESVISPEDFKTIEDICHRRNSYEIQLQSQSGRKRKRASA